MKKSNGMVNLFFNLQYELSQEESDLLKAGLYFSIQPDKTQKFKIFTTFEKIHHSFINNLKSKETKSQINRPDKSPTFCTRLPHFEEKYCLPPTCKNF